ncbi:MAG: hypothetical protein ACTHNG_14070 [Ginsengibacter sp.]
MKSLYLFLIFLTFYTSSRSQQITYSQPESQDSRALNFEIIGKIGDNFLIYKNIRNRYAICSYDNSMQMLDHIDLKFMPDNTLNVDFVAYPDFCWLIYQYQKRSVLHCMAVKINEEGKMMTDPIELDTTHINFFADNKIYSTINSEDKSKIMIYKIQKKNGFFNFTTLLFNDSLQLLHKSRIPTQFDDRKDLFSDFYVDNEGNFVFTKGNKSTTKDFIQDLDLVTKKADDDNFMLNSFDLKGNFLDAIKLKIDNVNKHYIINSLYYEKRHGNVEGVYTAVWDVQNKNTITQVFQQLGDSIRSMAKTNGNNKVALNNFFIRDVVLKKDGGFILTAEDYYSQSRYSPWNRYDYLYGYPSFSPYNYYMYSPYSYGYYGRNPYYYSGGQSRYYYNNVLVLDMDKTGKADWASVINKSQYDDQTDNYLSYATMLTGAQLHFLFNSIERRSFLLVDHSITGSGKVTVNPPFKTLDLGYEFMPRYGKQVSASQIIIPCTYRNYICFAKIEFP